uniref:Uncharacterized protein n=1 Tax=Cacopsylla melanoneura TaxID=428564 RepID=A0A8D8LWC6_9HEMI
MEILKNILNLPISSQLLLYKNTIVKKTLVGLDLYFLKQCLKYSLVPKFVYCKIQPTNLTLESKFKKEIVRNEINKKYAEQGRLSHQQMLLHFELADSLHQFEFDILDKMCRSHACTSKEEKRFVINKKLSHLKETQLKTDVKTTPQNFLPKFINISSVVLEKPEIDVLNMGLKYNPGITAIEKDMEMLKVDVAVPLSDLWSVAIVPLHTG